MKKIFTLKGRDTPKEYRRFILFGAILFAILSSIFTFAVIDSLPLDTDPLSLNLDNFKLSTVFEGKYALSMIVIAIILALFSILFILSTVRRLHDLNFKGLWVLPLIILTILALNIIVLNIPLTIITLILMYKKGSDEENDYNNQ